MARTAKVERKTRETDLTVEVNLDGTGLYEGNVGVPFLEHMLELFAKHSLIDVAIGGSGDLPVDPHHTVEDLGICLGQAIDEALGDRAGIVRYGHTLCPMEEVMATIALDFSGRPRLVWRVGPNGVIGGAYDSQLSEEFWEAVCRKAGLCLHVICEGGKNYHHIQEACFKGIAHAVRRAIEIDPRIKGVLSTKGTI
jgi:imidazoleglycerol-phosphate dehydratase